MNIIYKFIVRYEYRKIKMLLGTVLITFLSYVSSLFWNNLKWDPALEISPINKSEYNFDMILLYQYSFNVPIYANLIGRKCSINVQCSIEQIQDVVDKHIEQTELLFKGYCSTNVNLESMKTTVICPVIVNYYIKGYVITGSILNMDTEFMIDRTKKLADDIADKSFF